MKELVLATRSAHKRHEIITLLPALEGIRILDLNSAGVVESAAENDIEHFDTFEENALAKARYFSPITGAPVLADDSGLCVDALGGAPGVRSRRFSGRADLMGTELDEANNAHLLEALAGVEPRLRTAHYVCVLALRTPEGQEDLFRGTVEGLILPAPRGSDGFGYDPLFFVPSLDATFAEVPLATKNRISHRGVALAKALPRLREIALR